MQTHGPGVVLQEIIEVFFNGWSHDESTNLCRQLDLVLSITHFDDGLNFLFYRGPEYLSNQHCSPWTKL